MPEIAHPRPLSTLAARALLGALALLGAPPPVTAGEPSYVEWLDGVAVSAQTLAEGDASASERAATRALAARPRGAAADRARLARGLALRAGGRSVDAAVEIERALPAVEPALAAAVRLEWATATLAAGRAPQAASRFAALARESSGSLAWRARRGEADALLAAGDPRRAAETYEALLPSAPAGESAAIRLALAGAWRATGEHARAAAAYRSLWLDAPADAAGREAGRTLAAWQRSGGPVASPTVEEQLARAERLVRDAHPRQALRALDRLPAALASPDAARAALLRALASLPLGRSADAVDAARCADVPGAAAGTRVGARLVIARTAARAGRVDEAVARYAALSREPPVEVPGLAPSAARDLATEAGYLSAWLLFDAGRYGDASVALRRYADERPRSPRALDARWFEAWSLHRLGRKEGARRALARLERTALAPAALYWGARLAPPAAARALYRRTIAADDPVGWYALLATARLAARGEQVLALVPARASPIPDGPGEGAAADALGRAAAMLAVGLREAGLAELRSLAGSAAGRPTASLVAQLAAATGDAELPFRIARDQLALTGRTIRWAYPVAFPALLPVAANAGVDRSLLLALLRRESSFRADARSPAGAVGLVQLLPATAERLARLLGVAPACARRLEDPETSLALGAAYLGLLEDRFGDDASVLFAYNGGPQAAAAWARARAGRPLDEAVEEIPYRESRRYVKTVLAARAVYGWLWEGAPLALDGARPLRPPRNGVAF